MRGARAQLTRRGLVVMIVVVLVGGAVFGGAVFGFGFGGAGERVPETPTVASETTVGSQTPTTRVTPAATVTMLPTPVGTPTVTSSPRNTQSQTPTDSPAAVSTTRAATERYEAFVNTFLAETAEETQVPIRIRGGTYVDNEWWVVINATSPAVNDTRRTEEWGGLVTGYIRAYYFHNEGQVSGERPEAMRVLEINNTGLLPKTFIINNTVAHQAQYGGMTAPEVVESYFNTLRNQTTEEQHIVIENDRQGINGTLGPNGTITKTD